MASQTKAAGSGLTPYRLSVRQFELMIDAGVFDDGARVELIAGLLVDTRAKNDPHDAAVTQIAEKLRGVLPSAWTIHEEKSVVLGKRDRPEPDIAVVHGKPLDFFTRAPRSAEVGMLNEVADTSHAKNRGAKWNRDASASISSYWIVNLPARQIEVYSTIVGAGKSAAYRDGFVYGLDAEMPVVLEGREVGRILVKELFG